MKTPIEILLSTLLLLPGGAFSAGNAVLGWNNLGMHCMDSDYSVFSILPPYNTIEAQIIVNGLLVTNGSGYTVTYQAVADPAGSFNSTARGKGNFYEFALPLFGASLPVDAGLLGWDMPGAGNAPQTMLFERTNEPVPGVFTAVNWWRAEGIPLSPYDDAGRKNTYPLMLLVACDPGNTVIATNQIVLPISDEMDCRACHASGSGAAAKPAAGWVWSGMDERDFRLNILRLHDQHEFTNHSALYQAALAAGGFNPQGLYRNVVADGKPILCAACHADVALLAGGYSGVPAFTASMHAYHAHVMDPIVGATLDNMANRSACYRCHPGSTTQCLRGAMGGAVAGNGSMEMQCQSCHGNMTSVGLTNRIGWLNEPLCQSCHSGTATSNSGQVRYTSAFINGAVRIPANNTFATQPDTPAAGISLFRFSAGHGGLQCEACHGSTHAEFPSTHLNDNLRNVQLQGHAGVMVECTACHVSMSVTSTTAAGGPHGMHPVGQSWVSSHPDHIASLAACAACHGGDYRGTVLSRAQTSRTLTAHFDSGAVTLNLFRGAIVGCYTCHRGPSNDGVNNANAPTVSNVSANTTSGRSAAMALPVTGSGAVLRIISQPAHGSVGLTNQLATYFPEPGFVGTDTFTFAAYDGSKNSSLAAGTVSVAQGPFSVIAQSHVPASYPENWPAPFGVIAVASNVAAAVVYDWNFGDGSLHATNQYAMHSYAAAGNYNWTVIVRVQSGSGSASATNSGVINISAPIAVRAAKSGGAITFSWPATLADAVLEEADGLGLQAQWKPVTNLVADAGGVFSVSLNLSSQYKFLRLRQVK